ncbi:hypothetical protein DdX_14715 [Ditylenchus destructor]|uniref:Secreted protein n=1 Tax=Ditylenchus destructor TaxID=166010 RepID=A0AAD4R1Q3_9BILA|nr:hypothetical protein DdX_14715 [Ditylenchus destructor]
MYRIALIAFFSLDVVCAMFGYPNAKPLSSYGIKLRTNKYSIRIGEGAGAQTGPVLRDEHYYTVIDRKIYELDNLEFNIKNELRQQSENIESIEHYCETHKTEVESCSEVTPISKEAALSPVQIIKRQNAGQVAIGKGKDMKFGPLLKFDEFYTAVGQTIYKLEDLGARRKVLTNTDKLSNYLAQHNMLIEETSKDDPKRSKVGALSSSQNAFPSEDTDVNKTATNTKAEVSPKDEQPKIDPNAKKASSTHCNVQ